MLSRGTSSKATPTTLCQKCLKRGHYSYECTASQQDRPYQARPSRTQQLFNPKLKPKLTETKLVEPESITSKVSKTKEEWVERRPVNKQQRRARSVSSSDSVSTISTSRSRSRSPVTRVRREQDVSSKARRSRSPYRRRGSGGQAERRRTRSRSPALDGQTRNGQHITQETTGRQRSPSPYSKRVAMHRRE